MNFFDELAAQIAAIEQSTAAALAALQADLTELRGMVASLSSDTPAPFFISADMAPGPMPPAFNEGYDFPTGIDPAAIVTTDRAAVIRVAHTFDNETTPQSPFALGANTAGQLVSGLNADQLDGFHASAFNNVAVTIASGGLALTTSLQDVPGVSMTFTPAFNEKVLIVAAPELNQYAGSAPTNNSDAVTVEIQLNGALLFQANFVADGGNGSRGVTRSSTATCNSGASATIRMQAKNGTGARGQIGAATQMIVWRLPA